MEEAKKLCDNGKITDTDCSMLCIRAYLGTIVRINRDGSSVLKSDTDDYQNWIPEFQKETAIEERYGNTSSISEAKRLEKIVESLEE